MTDQTFTIHSITATENILAKCDVLTFKNIRTIEGWIQIDPLQGENQTARLITICFDPKEFKENKNIPAHFENVTNNKTEFYIEFAKNQIQLGCSDGILKTKAIAPIADGMPHYISLTLPESIEEFSLIIDSNKPILIPYGTKAPDLLINSVTIGKYKNTPGFKGGIFGLHFWNDVLTADETSAISQWRNSHCPTPDFGFTSILPSELLGFLNPDSRAFLFYREPTGYWIMDGTEPDVPKQADLEGFDQHHHAIYKAPRYFLTVREKESGKLYIINDKEEPPMLIQPDETKHYGFKSDDLIFDFKYKILEEVVHESFSFLSVKDKQIPDIFKSEPDCRQKCLRPSQLPENYYEVEQTLNSIFSKNPYNSIKMMLGWNVLCLKDTFKSFETGANNKIFTTPPGHSHDYDFTSNMAIPYGLKYIPGGTSFGSMHSSLVANGVDLRKAATYKNAKGGEVSFGCVFLSDDVSLNFNSELSETEEQMYNHETMISTHTYFVGHYTLVLDKSNVKLTDEINIAGVVKGFKPSVMEFEDNEMSGRNFFERFGTHYANAIRYGARGIATETYTKKNMSDLLQNLNKAGWAVEAKVSGSIDGFSGSAKVNYSEEEMHEDSEKITTLHQASKSDFLCIGGGCNKDGIPTDKEDSIVPVLLDLRPITELLAPPFFDTYEITVTLRNKLKIELEKYLSINKPVRNEDVFSFYALRLGPGTCTEETAIYDPSKPNGEKISISQDNVIISSPGSIKVTGIPQENEMTIVIDSEMWKNGGELYSLDEIIENSHKIQVEFTPPALLGTGRWVEHEFKDLFEFQNGPTLKLLFDLGLEKVDSNAGLRKDFVIKGYLNNLVGYPHIKDWPPNFNLVPMRTISYSVTILKLDINNAFFCGLPTDWKKAMKQKNTHL